MEVGTDRSGYRSASLERKRTAVIENARVIVGVNGSLSSPAAVYRAVEEAGRRNAVLVPVIAWSGTDHEQLRPLPELEHAVRKRLDTVFEQAFGGYPSDIVIRPVVVHADAGRALVAAADRPTDLLVLDRGHHGRLHHALHGSVARYCRAHAACEGWWYRPPNSWKAWNSPYVGSATFVADPTGPSRPGRPRCCRRVRPRRRLPPPAPPARWPSRASG
ncbi:nucleotide-binding universal stress UspA family protein [Kitasatospora atroaurantiaca]|uniref:Nucleotide-binding universal stress UspA family protein n=1 Tax=Kitasatospora atroaurantiaca TaxID=285545 RepID=A0A561EJZ1_9ACTN|nr:nucleotide-binding universal stress UspA family protein [Kitasatospora atroaurantiaca]